ncbi:MAG: hypothetical protein V8R08_02875 [Coriobacteriales bacterium]
MSEGGWFLEPITDFVFLLAREGEAKNILQRRFKKDRLALVGLFDIIEKVDGFGYEDGIRFAFDCKYMESISARNGLGLIEIRVKRTLWRVVTYHDRKRKKLVILDAFEAHRHKTMEHVVEQVEPRRVMAIRLLEEAG